MEDLKKCPKCGSSMAAGTLKEIGNYGNTPYEYVPEDDAPFPVKGVQSKRKKLMLYRCRNCGYIELYAQ